MAHISSFYPDSDTYIDSYYANTNFCNYIITWIGKKSCNRIFYTLLKFNISELPKDAVITRATLKVFVDFVQNDNVTDGFTPYAITTNWEETTVTWANCPTYDAHFTGSTASMKGVGWYEFDLTEIVKSWCNHSLQNYGVLLKSDGHVSMSSKRLVSSKMTKHNQAIYKPSLSISYDFVKPAEENVRLTGRRFIEKTIGVKTTDEFTPTVAFDTSMQSQVTLFVFNGGHHAAILVQEVGPNEVNFVQDEFQYDVLPGKVVAVVPKIYGKYTRLLYKSKNSSQHTSLKITLQSFV